MHWNEDTFWKALPYLLPVVAYIFGWLRDKWNLPKPIAKLLANKAVMALVAEGVRTAAALAGRTNEERREYAREWLKKALQTQFGQFVPDSALNFLIEKVIVQKKARVAK